MILFDPVWVGLDYTQDTPPSDGVTFLSSVVNAQLTAQSQMESDAIARSLAQTEARAVAENMLESALFVGASV